MRRGGTWVERSRPWAMESLSASLARPASATARCASPLASSLCSWSPFTFPNICDQAHWSETCIESNTHMNTKKGDCHRALSPPLGRVAFPLEPFYFPQHLVVVMGEVG